MPDTALGVMAKYPIAGKVKTRLARDIGAGAALAVYCRLLRLTCDLVTALPGRDYHRAAFVSPGEKVNTFASRYAGFDAYIEQTGDDLGGRMVSAFKVMLSSPGVSHGILIGADCPELSLEILTMASDLLVSNDLVLGPTADGGYYLIALKAVCKDLFTGIKWGSETVFSETIKAATATKLSVGRLPRLRDLDDRHDLEYFIRHELKDFGKVD